MGEALIVNNNNDDTDRFLYFFWGEDYGKCDNQILEMEFCY